MLLSATLFAALLGSVPDPLGSRAERPAARVPLVRGPDLLEEAREQLLRGEVEAASATLDELEASLTPGEQGALAPSLALLRAAAAPPAERPRAFLEVAERFPASDETDVALLAGSRAQQRLRWEDAEWFRPLLLDPEAKDPEDVRAIDTDDFEPPDFLEQRYRTALERRELDPSHDEELHARATSIWTFVARGEFAPVRVRTGTPLRLPSPRASDLLVRVERRRAELDRELGWSVPAADDLVLEIAVPKDEANATLPPLPAGHYTIMLEGEHGDRAQRGLLVSDLDLVVQRRGNRALVLATFAGKACAGVEVTGTAIGDEANGTAPVVVRTDGSGLAILPCEEGDLGIEAAYHEPGTDGVHRARTSVERSWSWQADPARRVHVHVDAPLHRVGETLRGRVIVRSQVREEVEALLGTTEVVTRDRPTRSSDLVLRFWNDTSKELVLRRTTNEHGVAEFEIPITEETPVGTVSVEVFERIPPDPAEHRAETDVSRGTFSPCVIAAVQRPPLLLSLGAPTSYTLGADRPGLELTATLPGGAPASRLRAALTVAVGSFEERRSFRLDTRGRATLPLACDTWFPEDFLRRGVDPQLSWKLELVAPDGQVVTREGAIELLGTRSSEATSNEPTSNEPTSDELDFRLASEKAFAGEPVELTLRGPPSTPVLVSVGRSGFLAAKIVEMDAAGNGRLHLETTASWFPEVRVAVSAVGTSDTSRWVSCERPEDPVRARLVEDGRSFAPGTKTVLHLETIDARGRPVPATVSVAIVDESLYLLREDLTRPLAESLAVSAPGRSLERSGSPGSTEALRVLGELMDAGGPGGTVAYGAGGPGGYRGPGDVSALGLENLRQDLRSVAAFLPCVRTDAEGRAEIPVDLPDDLTRFRVTMVPVPDVGAGEIGTAHVVTERDPSVRAVVPRFLREGDRVLAALTAYRAAGPSLDVRFRTLAEGSLTANEVEAPREKLGAGESVETSFAILAGDEGTGSVTVSLREGADESSRALDAERREVPVLTRSVPRRWSTSTVLDDSGREFVLGVRAPDGAPVDVQRLRLVADARDLLRSTATWLDHYPYGCAEQTISRLVPIFLAARRAGDPRALDAQRLRRFTVGASHLAQLRRADGYSWWQGGDADVDMTPVVLTGLALAKDAGFDPRRSGCQPRIDAGLLDRASESLFRYDGRLESLLESKRLTDEDRSLLGAASDPELAALRVAEYGVAVLAFQPNLQGLRQNVRRLVEQEARLSASLVLRAGIALARAGDREAAEHCLERVNRGETTARCTVPLETSAAAIAARRLELSTLLERPDFEQSEAIGELLALARDGRFGTTWASALALAALDRHEVSFGSGIATVEVRWGNERRSVSLGGEHEPTAVLDVPANTEISLRLESGRGVWATAELERGMDGAEAKAWATPLRVERRLFRVQTDEGGAEQRVPVDLAAAELRIGETYEMELDLRGPSGSTYLVLDAPLPAGCEWLGSAGDRARANASTNESAVWAFSNLGEEDLRQVRARFVPGFAGDVVWPPARAEAMYRVGVEGGSDGAKLRILATEADEVATPVWASAEARLERIEEWLPRVRRREDPRELDGSVVRSLGRFPDARARERLAELVEPFLLDLETDVDTLFEALGPVTARWLDGQSFEPLLARSSPTFESLLALAGALSSTAEGRSLLARWRGDDPTLAPVDAQLCTLHWLEHGELEQVQDLLRLLDRVHRETAVPAEQRALFAHARWLALSRRSAIRWDLGRFQRECCFESGIRDTDPERSAPLRSVGEFLEGLRHEVETRPFSIELARTIHGAVRFESFPQAPGGSIGSAERELAEVEARLVRAFAEWVARSLESGDELALGPDLDADLRAFDLVDQGEDRERALERVELVLRAAADSRSPLAEAIGARILWGVEGEVKLASSLGQALRKWRAERPQRWTAEILEAFAPGDGRELPVEWWREALEGEGATETCVRALLATPAGARALLDSLDRLSESQREGVWAAWQDRELDWNLEDLADSTLLSWIPHLEAFGRAAVARELGPRVRERPRDFAALLLATQDVEVEDLLVPLLVEAPAGTVAFDPEDPSTVVLETMFRARRGAPDALQALRHWIDEAHQRPSEERERYERALLPRATLLDLQAERFDLLDGDEIHIAEPTRPELRLWFEEWRRGCEEYLRVDEDPLDADPVLEHLSPSALRTVEPWLGLALRDLEGVAAEWLATSLYDFTGIPREYRDEDGLREVVGPSDDAEREDALLQHLRFTSGRADFVREADPDMRAAFRRLLADRGLLLPRCDRTAR